MYLRFLPIVFWFVVRVVAFHESLACSLLVLLHLLLGMRPHVLMHLDMAGDTQQHDVVGIIASGSHTVGAFHCLGLLNRSDVMHVHAWRDDAFLQAHLAQSVGASEHRSTQQLPPWAVQ